MSKNVIVNFVLFQIGWFVCVLGAAKQMPWVGVIFMLCFLAWHLSQALRAKHELILVIITVIIGGIYDFMMTSNHLLTYQSPGWGAALPAAWILALWAEFAMILNVSLRWMKKRYVIALLFGAIGGPLAYIGAARLGAVSIDALPLSYVALSVGWAIVTPLLLFLSEKLDGFKPLESTKT
ncbi:MAG: DUF2878 domain-containing protein [Bdellovibrio sp.]|nr:DUF2878 domain-containing protein [Methylotenera sp.]